MNRELPSGCPLKDICIRVMDAELIMDEKGQLLGGRDNMVEITRVQDCMVKSPEDCAMSTLFRIMTNFLKSQPN